MVFNLIPIIYYPCLRKASNSIMLCANAPRSNDRSSWNIIHPYVIFNIISSALYFYPEDIRRRRETDKKNR